MLHDDNDVEVLSGLSRFRDRFYECLDVRADALFELADAAVCADGPVTSLAEQVPADAPLMFGIDSTTFPRPNAECSTADQIRDLAGRLSKREEPVGRPAPLFILDQGYAAAALTHALDGLQVQTLYRVTRAAV